MKRSVIIASTAALTLFPLFAGQSCSGEEGANQQSAGPLTGTGGTAANPPSGNGGGLPVGTAGTQSLPPPAGGSGSDPEGQGGAPIATGGTGTGAATGAAAATGTGGTQQTGTGGASVVPPDGPPECMTAESPSNGESCTVTCTDLCGVFNLGSRVCTCGPAITCDPGNAPPCMDCAGCGFSVEHPLLVPPTGPLTLCAEDDEVMEGGDEMNPPPACVENERCQSIRPDGGEGRFCGCLGGEWDCDSKPMNFPE